MRTSSSKVVAVTGASSGVGRESALAFARKGAVVVLIARREGALEQVAARCRRTAAAVLVRPAEPSDPEAIAAIASDVYQRFGRIDVWVNVASVNMLSAVERRPDEVWHRRVERRLFATYHSARTVIPYMRMQGRGVIINVPSVLSRPGEPFHDAVLAGKDTVRAISFCLRREASEVDDVTVSAVIPGPVPPPASMSEPEDRFAPLLPILSPRRAARAVVACAKVPRGEITVDSGPRPLSALLGTFQDVVDRALHARRKQDPIIGTLGPTIEHRQILPGLDR